MARAGWSKLIPSEGGFQGFGAFRIDAYSEYMPAPRVGRKPYGPVPLNNLLFSPDDPFGWNVHEFDETLKLRPGIYQIAKQLMARLKRLLEGKPEVGLPRHVSEDNPFWPPELASGPNVPQDRCVLLLPLALTRSQDDKGRVRWTLFGNSERGPGKAFWKGFFTAPGVEAPPEFGIGFFCRLLQAVCGEKVEDADGLRRVGLRILPDDQPDYPFWNEGELPSWRRLASPLERRGVSRGLSWRPRIDRATGHTNTQAALTAGQAPGPVQDDGPRRLCVAHDRPQPRPRARHLSDLTGQ